jgi:hypothetical protein
MEKGGSIENSQVMIKHVRTLSPGSKESQNLDERGDLKRNGRTALKISING